MLVWLLFRDNLAKFHLNHVVTLFVEAGLLKELSNKVWGD